MELPEEVVVLILEKLQLPELRCAIFVCKSWKKWILKERFYPCPILRIRKKKGLHIRALVNKEWYEISMSFVMDAQSLRHHGRAKYKRLLESLVSLHENRLLYLLVEQEEGSKPVKLGMVLTSNYWTGPVVKKLPLDPLFNLSEPNHVTLNLASVWMDNRDCTGSSYKVLLFFYYRLAPQDGFVMAFDSNKDEWTRATMDCEGNGLEAPIVKGNLCYALNGSKTKLVFYDFEAGGVFQDVAAFPLCHINPSFFTENLMVEFQEQLLFIEKAFLYSTIKLFIVELHTVGIEIRKLAEVDLLGGSPHYISGIKAGKNKLYIDYIADGKYKLMEWSLEETRDVPLPEVLRADVNSCIW